MLNKKNVMHYLHYTVPCTLWTTVIEIGVLSSCWVTLCPQYFFRGAPGELVLKNPTTCGCNSRQSAC